MQKEIPNKIRSEVDRIKTPKVDDWAACDWGVYRIEKIVKLKIDEYDVLYKQYKRNEIGTFKVSSYAIGRRLLDNRLRLCTIKFDCFSLDNFSKIFDEELLKRINKKFERNTDLLIKFNAYSLPKIHCLTYRLKIRLVNQSGEVNENVLQSIEKLKNILEKTKWTFSEIFSYFKTHDIDQYLEKDLSDQSSTTLIFQNYDLENRDGFVLVSELELFI